MTNKEILIALVDAFNRCADGDVKSFLYPFYRDGQITQFELKKMKYMIDLRNYLCHGGMLEEEVTDNDLLFIAKVVVKIAATPGVYERLSDYERFFVSNPKMIVANLKML